MSEKIRIKVSGPDGTAKPIALMIHTMLEDAEIKAHLQLYDGDRAPESAAELDEINEQLIDITAANYPIEVIEEP